MWTSVSVFSPGLLEGSVLHPAANSRRPVHHPSSNLLRCRSFGGWTGYEWECRTPCDRCREHEYLELLRPLPKVLQADPLLPVNRPWVPVCLRTRSRGIVVGEGVKVFEKGRVGRKTGGGRRDPGDTTGLRPHKRSLVGRREEKVERNRVRRP